MGKRIGSTAKSSVGSLQAAALSHDLFRKVMSSFVTGVTVVTTQVEGEIRGMTANAFMSGSIEPPLCAISVNAKARMHAFLLKSGHFGVSILAHGQDALIGHFAGRPVDGIDVKYEYAGTTPLLANAHATIAAKVIARHPCGDHSIFVGRIFALRQGYSAAPLAMHHGRLVLIVPSHEHTIEPALDFW